MEFPHVVPDDGRLREMGVRTDVPFKDLTEKEKNIVYNGPAEEKAHLYMPRNSNQAGELDFTYYNAVYTVENALAKVKDRKGHEASGKVLKTGHLPGLRRFQTLGGSESAEAPGNLPG